MNINGYDEWKLSNPWDDGHYKEDPKPCIETAIYYKFLMNYNKRWCYGMITTSGHDIKIWHIGNIRTIDVDEIEPYAEDAQAEIDRVQANYQGFEHITMQEFYAEFEQAHNKILKLVQRETNY